MDDKIHISFNNDCKQMPEPDWRVLGVLFILYTLLVLLAVEEGSPLIGALWAVVGSLIIFGLWRRKENTPIG